MSERTAIQWADSTWNPWFGCTKVGPGCDHCYAAAQMDTRLGRVRWGARQPRVRTSPAYWRKPIEWNRWQYFECASCRWRGSSKETICLGTSAFRCPQCYADPLTPTRRRVFCASLADVFDNEVDTTWRRDLFELILRTHNLDWILLTKRIGNVLPMLEELKKCARFYDEWAMFDRWLSGEPPANIWLGSTICNQAEADRDIIKLLRVPARVHFLSLEPMLGAVDLTRINLGESAVIETFAPEWDGVKRVRFTLNALSGAPKTGIPPVNWIIAGGESGPHARPAHPDWFRSLRDQCAAAGVPFMFKQWGEWGTGDCDDERTPIRDSAGLRPSGDAVFSYSPPFDDGDALEARGGVRLDGRTLMLKVGKARAGRLLDGREHNEFPEPRP